MEWKFGEIFVEPILGGRCFQFR